MSWRAPKRTGTEIKDNIREVLAANQRKCHDRMSKIKSSNRSKQNRSEHDFEIDETMILFELSVMHHDCYLEGTLLHYAIWSTASTNTATDNHPVGRILDQAHP